jgi:Tfp pilus assembly protein PilF
LAAAHFYLAEILFQMGDLAGALPEYERACKLNPTNGEFSRKFGLALFKIRPQEAVMEIKRSIDLDPRNAAGHQILAQLLRRTGDLPGSSAELQKAKELTEEGDRQSDADVHVKAAAQYIRKNDTADGIKELRLALAAEPDSPDANHLLGVALSAEGNWSEADQAFKAALQKKPSDPQIHFNFGVSLGHQHDWQGAAREFRFAVSLRPGYAQAHCLLASALAHIGYADASKEFTLAREFGSCGADSTPR